MKSLIVALVLIGLFSCKQEPSSLNGLWKSHGSGWILSVSDSSQYQLYDVTDISCVLKRDSPLRELLPSLSLEGDTLLLRKGISDYKFYRVDQMPDSYHLEQDSDDVLFNFEVFAETVRSHYAFLELNDIDWEELSSKQRDRLESDPTELTLYRVLEESLVLLNDNHGFLEASDEFYDKFEAELEEYYSDETDTLPEYGDFNIANMVTKAYLTEDQTKDSWLINWGKMTDDIAYAQIKAMWLYADLDIPDAMKEEMGFVDAYVTTFHQMDESRYIQLEKEGVSKILDQMTADFSEMDTIILDVRFNGGGQDVVSQEIIRRFNPSTNIAFKRMLKTPNGYIHAETISLNPGENAIDRPVYVLVSPQSGSAAESFAMAARQAENMKLIGSPTLGALSTALEKKLPNGWHFAISDEMYLDPEGTSFENTGVPVDVDLDYLRDRQPFFRYVADHLEEDRDDVLRAIRE